MWSRDSFCRNWQQDRGDSAKFCSNKGFVVLQQGGAPDAVAKRGFVPPPPLPLPRRDVIVVCAPCNAPFTRPCTSRDPMTCPCLVNFLNYCTLLDKILWLYCEGSGIHLVPINTKSLDRLLQNYVLDGVVGQMQHVSLHTVGREGNLIARGYILRMAHSVCSRPNSSLPPGTLELCIVTKPELKHTYRYIPWNSVGFDLSAPNTLMVGNPSTCSVSHKKYVRYTQKKRWILDLGGMLCSFYSIVPVFLFKLSKAKNTSAVHASVTGTGLLLPCTVDPTRNVPGRRLQQNSRYPSLLWQPFPTVEQDFCSGHTMVLCLRRVCESVRGCIWATPLRSSLLTSCQNVEQLVTELKLVFDSRTHNNGIGRSTQACLRTIKRHQPYSIAVQHFRFKVCRGELNTIRTTPWCTLTHCPKTHNIKSICRVVTRKWKSSMYMWRLGRTTDESE